MTAYPVEKFPELWSELPLTSLPDSSRELVCEKLIKHCTQAIKDWQESSDMRNESSARQLVSYYSKCINMFRYIHVP